MANLACLQANLLLRGNMALVKRPVSVVYRICLPRLWRGFVSLLPRRLIANRKVTDDTRKVQRSCSPHLEVVTYLFSSLSAGRHRAF
jgi:hypothetical protein